VLAHVSRRREWGGTPVLIVYACVCAAISLLKACSWWHAEKEMVMLLFCAFTAILVELGARSGEKALQGAAFIATALMSVFGFWFFSLAMAVEGGVYAVNLVSRIESIWPVPTLVAFCGWRLGGLKLWRDFIRALAYPAASVMTFAVVTMESHFFGREFLPFLRGGIVTIVWAAVASAFLATGIVRRVRVLRLVGLGLLALSAAKVLLVDTASLATPGRVGVFAAVGILLIVGAFLYLRFKARFEAYDAGSAEIHSRGEDDGNE
jgi:predicted membrane channel-forming protein YqfA (hemolysin III family)